MPLIHNNNLSVYAGVSKQAIDLRLPNHCEEMINCYPSVQYGLRRRNPTRLISETISVEENQFLHTYDRGLAGETEERYVITIDKTNGLRVFDVDTNEYRTVTYTGNARTYLESSNPEIGFAAITIKDTTFIANKDFIPIRVGEFSSAVNYAKLTVNLTGYSKSILAKSTTSTSSTSVVQKTITGLAPARIKTWKIQNNLNASLVYYAIASVGATISVVVDGTITIKYTTKTITDTYNIYPESMSSWRLNLTNTIKTYLGAGYTVEVAQNGEVFIYDMSGTALTVTTSLAFPSSVVTTAPAVALFSNITWVFGGMKLYTVTVYSEANNGSNPITVTTGSSTKLLNTNTSDDDKKAFIWIKQVSVDTAFPYTFYVTLKETNGTVIATTSSSSTTATGVASAISSWATGLADFTGSADGSVVKITRDSGAAFDVVVSDTYGSQASSSWKGATNQMEDLPKSFPFKDTIVRIDGVNTVDSAKYWVKYDGNQWIEHRDPNMLYRINADTMPHKLVRNPDYSFTMSPIAWEDIAVGDEDTQTLPEFIGNTIQDLFFVNGRLGILTSNGISLSQTNNAYNFFRTTVLELLDDSPVVTYIDSSKSVGLKYASELQGAIVLFGDKMQFVLDASKPISPKTISVQPISGFEINRNVKPISSADSVFFLVSNSGYSSLMEMNKNTLSMNIRANDVSAHVPNYIDPDIMQIVSSQRDNAVFLRSRSKPNTIYVYKHYGTDEQKVQMAWSKWTFDMNIQAIFVFNKELYIFGSRYDVTVPLDEFSLVSTWDDSKIWIDETYWAETGILATPSFEKIDIETYHIGALFKDLGTVRYNSEIVLSEWALSVKDAKEMRGNLLIKTAEISSEEDSNFYLVVKDKERNTEREIPAIYTVDRKPYISGNAKNMEIKLSSTNGDGFQINAISLEGQYNVRSRRQ